MAQQHPLIDYGITNKQLALGYKYYFTTGVHVKAYNDINKYYRGPAGG